MQNIFKWFTLEDSKTVPEIDWFAETLEPTEFEGVEALLAAFLHYCSELAVLAKRGYLESFLVTDGKKSIFKYAIKLDTMEHFDYKDAAALEEAYRILGDLALKTYDAYSMVDLTEKTFKVDAYEFLMTKQREKVQVIMAKTFPKLSSGEDTMEVVEEMEAELDNIREVYDPQTLDYLDFVTGSTRSADSTGDNELVGKTGIPAIDGDLGGVFTQRLVSLNGQPGAGKTRLMCIHFAYNLAVIEKVGVLFNSIELTKKEIENIMIAHHIRNLYKGKVKIPDKLMNEGKLTDVQKQYVEAARIDLFETPGKYGKIAIEAKMLSVEELQKHTKKFLKSNPDVKVWCLDYVGALQSLPKGKYSKELIQSEVIEKAYIIGKCIAKKTDTAVVFANQFTKEGIEAIAAGKRVQPGHTQGGQSVQRWSDYDVAMTCTDEQKMANLRMMSTTKVRAATGFANVPIKVDLSISTFEQVTGGLIKTSKKGGK